MVTPAGKQTDAERVKVALPRVYGQVARQRLMGLSSPEIVSADDIERNGTRVKRTERLLKEKAIIWDTRYTLPEGDPRNSYHGMWQVLTFEEQSAAYGLPSEYTASKVFTDVEAILTGTRSTTGYSRYGQYNEQECQSGVNSLLAAGWKNIEQLTNFDAIYIWWHRDQYVFDKGQTWVEGGTYKTVLIKKLYEDYLTATTRAVVDVYIKYEMRHLLAEDIGVPELPKKADSDTSVPLFSHHVTLLCPANFAVAQTKYRKLVCYAQNLQKAAEKQAEVIKSYGGLVGYMEHLRRRAVVKLVEDAPFHVVKESDDSFFSPYAYSNKEEFDHTKAAKYVLEHLGAFEYDRLYPKGFDECLLNVLLDDESEEKDSIASFGHEDSVKALLSLY